MTASNIEIEIFAEKLSDHYLISPNDLHRGFGEWEGLSPAARCLLAALLTIPSGWKTGRAYIDRIMCPAGRSATDTAIRELVDRGHVTKVRHNAGGGRFVWRWTVHVKPHHVSAGGTTDGFSVDGEPVDGDDQGKHHVSAGGTTDGFSIDGQSGSLRSNYQPEVTEEPEQLQTVGVVVGAHTKPTLLPDDFAVTPEMTAWGRSVVPDLAGRGETGRFVAYHRAAGTLSDDWESAWQQWMVGASTALRAAATNPSQEAVEALNPTGADTNTPPAQNAATGDDRGAKPSEQKSPTEPKPARSPRGVRLPEAWAPTQALLDWATAEHPKIDLRLETDKFRDHWLSKAGRDATKVDWGRAWRNWIRNARPTWDAARRGPTTEAERLAQAAETIHYLREHKPVNPYKAAAAECGLPWGDLGPGTKNDNNDDVIGAPKVQPAIDWVSMMGSPG